MTKLKLKAGSRPPWVGLAAAVWVQISAGNGSNFPLYSSALKSVLGFNQQQLTFLGVANDIGESVGLLPGIASNRFPPWTVLLVGVFACFLGYGVIWLAVTQTIHALPYWLLWIALVVGSNSNAWFSTAVLVTNMRNFPLSRGTVSGILKGYSGISAAVYTVLYSSLLERSASKLLLFLTLGIPVLCLAMMYFVRPCTPPSGEDSSVHVHFVFTQVASVLLAIYLIIITVIYDIVSLSDAFSYVLLAIVFIFLIAPLGIPVKMTLTRANAGTLTPLAGSTENLTEGEGGPTHSDPLLSPSSSASNLGSFFESEYASDVETLLAVGEGAVKKKRRPRRGEDFKLHEAFIKADFWLLWVVYFLGVGSGVTVTNNLAQIGIAFGVDNTTILLSLFSFCNFIGRLGSSALSEHFVRTRSIPRTFWMACTLVVMVLAFVMYALAFSGTLYISTALLGICLGFQYCLMVPTASELFGLKHFGIIYNFMMIGNPVGALLFSGLLAGSVYDAEAAKQGSSICLGPECFRLTFFVLAGICSLGSILGLFLTIRIRPVYQMLYASGSFRLPQGSGH
ncbi:putative Serine-rich protein-related [Hibiscus syriacus]|uniref:Serine-rich protein-related n=1 Tax=Hibiscus syriacus TaxID=106335 RepID=A0A6A2ZW25_HIBSY|nr:protein NUCLEAR FUSION DEFECTIVE 4-like [Hibiscus syriacus]KAE8696130.1 putative Serine-rich protein-related [Hibiscus syriacus]